MKKIFALLIIFCSVAVVTNAQSLQFEKEFIKLNVLPYGSDGTCELKLKNNGATSVSIKEVVASTKCVVIAKPNESILPSKTCIIKIRFDTFTIGSFERLVTVKTDDGKTSTISVLYIISPQLAKS